MALESATYISDLNSSYPLSTDTVSQSDDHLRLIKAAIKATFPNVSGPVTATQAQLNSSFPAGIIAMWSGSLIALPSGWALCDGTGGTPNLRDRFIVGAGSAYAVGALGGSLVTGAGGTHTHTEASAGGHDHGAVTGGTALSIAQMPAHDHTWSGTSTSEDNNYTAGTKYLKEGSLANNVAFTETTSSVGSGATHTHSITAEAAHSHSINSVGDHTHSILPPYFALAYIIKL